MTREELTAAIAADYTPKTTLKFLAEKYKLHPLTIRKHLVTAGAYSTEKTELVLSALQTVLEQNITGGQIMPALQELLSTAGSNGKPLSAQAIYSYLPYDVTESQTDAAERKRLQRERTAAMEHIVDFNTLWDAIVLFEGYPFYTEKGLLFRYKVRGREIFVNRKEKSITESSERISYNKTLEMNGLVKGPKKLGVFGASYLYPMFVRFGVIKK